MQLNQRVLPVLQVESKRPEPLDQWAGSLPDLGQNLGLGDSDAHIQAFVT
jgi:hypothetical protein